MGNNYIGMERHWLHVSPAFTKVITVIGFFLVSVAFAFIIEKNLSRCNMVHESAGKYSEVLHG